MSEARPTIGTKLYYSIGEVAELTQLPPYTLRSWEKEFPCLRPKRVRGKNRAFRARDIAIILLIKRLLHEERYSTRGARQKLRNEPELIRAAVDGMQAMTSDTGGEAAARGVSEDSTTARDTSSGAVSEAGARRDPVSRSSNEAASVLVEIRDELRQILRLLN